MSVLLANDCQDDAHSPLSSDTGSTELIQATWCHVISYGVMWLVINSYYIVNLCSVHEFNITEFTTAFLPEPCCDLCFCLSSCFLSVFLYNCNNHLTRHQVASWSCCSNCALPLPYFFDQTPRLLSAIMYYAPIAARFCGATILGRRLFQWTAVCRNVLEDVCAIVTPWTSLP